MDSQYVDDLVDEDEIPELTEEDFARMVPFNQLPLALQEKLRRIKHATIRPDPVKGSSSPGMPRQRPRIFSHMGPYFDWVLPYSWFQWCCTLR